MLAIRSPSLFVRLAPSEGDGLAPRYDMESEHGRPFCGRRSAGKCEIRGVRPAGGLLGRERLRGGVTGTIGSGDAGTTSIRSRTGTRPSLGGADVDGELHAR